MAETVYGDKPNYLVQPKGEIVQLALQSGGGDFFTAGDNFINTEFSVQDNVVTIKFIESKDGTHAGGSNLSLPAGSIPLKYRPTKPNGPSINEGHALLQVTDGGDLASVPGDLIVARDGALFIVPAWAPGVLTFSAGAATMSQQVCSYFIN